MYNISVSYKCMCLVCNTCAKAKCKACYHDSQHSKLRQVCRAGVCLHASEDGQVTNLQHARVLKHTCKMHKHAPTVWRQAWR